MLSEYPEGKRTPITKSEKELEEVQTSASHFDKQEGVNLKEEETAGRSKGRIHLCYFRSCVVYVGESII